MGLFECNLATSFGRSWAKWQDDPGVLSFLLNSAECESAVFPCLSSGWRSRIRVEQPR